MIDKLLIIGFVWPEPKSSAAGSRMLQLIELFKPKVNAITFVSTAKPTPNTYDLESIGISVAPIELNHSSFDAFIKAYNPDAVLFDRFMTEEQFGWRVAEQCPNAIRILDTEDLHGLRKGREFALKADQAPVIDHLQNDITKREIASIYRCDLSIIISESEMKLLIETFKVDASLLCYVPFLLDPVSSDSINTLPDYDQRQHFITVGNFLHQPNYDAVLYLRQTIWPLIKTELPEAELHIYGAYESQKVSQLNHTHDRFLIKGFIEDLGSVMQFAKVCLAPLRFGAGLKGKLIDAMQYGTPCMMSTIAAEGMFGAIQPNGFVEDDPEDFARKAIELYTNSILWSKSQRQGYDILNERFDKANHSKRFLERLTVLQDHLETHRQDNFTGQIIWHHSLLSTKYMSKWIEAKNK